MKKSIITKILLTIAAVLLVTDTVLLMLGFSAVKTTVRRTYVYYASAAATVAADLLDGADLERLRTDEDYAQDYRFVLEDLSRTNDLQYLYLYTPDFERDTITFDMVIYGSGSQELAKTERVPGTVVPYVLTETERRAWDGQTTGDVEETDNQYGHVLTAYSAVYDTAGKAVALVAADVSLDEAIASFLQRYQIMVVTVAASFVFILAVLAVLLKARVLKPAKMISTQMRQFASDRQAVFERIEVKGGDEIAQMAETFYQMTEEIDHYIKNINALTEEKHHREAEIGIAGRIQQGLLPRADFQSGSICLRAVMIPAQEVGGDFYDYFSMDDDLFCTVIADVSGKGVTAALFMASAITVVRQYAKLGYSPSEILFRTNNTLCGSNPEQLFITLFVGIYDSRTRKFVYANAGHNPPYLILASEENTASDGLQNLDGTRGMAIGIFEDEAYEESTVELKDNDTVFLYTDGVNEAVSRDKEFFGLRRLEQILSRQEREQCVQSVLDGVRGFAQDTPQSDDITMLAFCALPGFRLRVTAVLENLETVQQFFLENGQLADSLKKKLCLAVEEIYVNICSYAYDDCEMQDNMQLSEPPHEKAQQNGEISSNVQRDKAQQKGEPPGKAQQNDVRQNNAYRRGDVEIYMTVSDQVLVEIRDSGRAFDPREHMVDVEAYDIDTQIGGLGRLIAFELADRVDYEYSSGSNILTLTFQNE